MNRRAYLSLLAGGATGLAGCSGGGGEPVPTRTTAATATRTPTETPRANPDTVFVDGERGAPSNPGTADEPVSRIDTALDIAQPGETVFVRPGVYRQRFEVLSGGEPGAPITLTGPPDAVVRAPNGTNILRLRASHFHLTGLTFDGLIDPEHPESPDSYAKAPLLVQPRHETDAYLEDIVVAPHGAGNTTQAIVSLIRTRNVTVGPFEVIGPAGADYLLTGEPDHNGEIVYVGTSPSNLGADWNPWTEYDRTRNVLVQGIDNSAGYGHSELVNTKLGTHDVTVQYCTDGGGAQNTEDNPSASVRFQSYGATVRWCDLRNGQGRGVEIGSYKARDARKEKSDPSEVEQRGGTDNAVYGNRITGFDDRALSFPVVHGQSDQRHICGNTVDGATDGDPGRPCGDDVPTGDGIGHAAVTES